MVRKILLVILLVFVLVSIVQSPNESAGYARQGADLLTLGVQRIFQFFEALLAP